MQTLTKFNKRNYPHGKQSTEVWITQKIGKKKMKLLLKKSG